MKSKFIVLIVLILIVLFIVLFKSGPNIRGQTIGSVKPVRNNETIIVCNFTLKFGNFSSSSLWQEDEFLATKFAAFAANHFACIIAICHVECHYRETT